MRPEQKDLIRKTWQRLEAIGDPAAELFYERLFEADPSLRALFARSDLIAQRAKLLQALALVVASLDRLESLVPVLEELGRRHVAYGVHKGHYTLVGAALLWTFARSLGNDWTRDAEEAWAQAYALVSGIMAAAGEVAERSAG
jgi:hemoglobin-like flavoprotein